MSDTTEKVQVKARIPGDLRRRAYVALAEHELRFTGWVQTQLETWLASVEKERHREAHHATE